MEKETNKWSETAETVTYKKEINGYSVEVKKTTNKETSKLTHMEFQVYNEEKSSVGSGSHKTDNGSIGYSESTANAIYFGTQIKFSDVAVILDAVYGMCGLK